MYVRIQWKPKPVLSGWKASSRRREGAGAAALAGAAGRIKASSPAGGGALTTQGQAAVSASDPSRTVQDLSGSGLAAVLPRERGQGEGRKVGAAAPAHVWGRGVEVATHEAGNGSTSDNPTGGQINPPKCKSTPLRDSCPWVQGRREVTRQQGAQA